MIAALCDHLIRYSETREPDLYIGGRENTYMKRWYLIPKNRVFNIYLHHFLRSDDDRALHDHPWWNMSILLRGTYIEHRKDKPSVTRTAPAFAVRGGKSAHRIQLLVNSSHPDFPEAAMNSPMSYAGKVPEHPVWTIFITGPRFREWGFHCPQGWRHWKKFVDNRDNESRVGRGCE